MRLPTRRGFLLMAAGLPVCLAIILANQRLWMIPLAWAGIVALILLLDMALTTPARAIQSTARPPALLFIGATDPLDLRFRLAEGLQPLDLDLTLELNQLLTPLPQVSIRLEPGETQFEAPLTPLARGQGEVIAAHLRWTGPFGLMAAQTIIPLGIGLAIAPNTRAVAETAVNPELDEILLGLKPQPGRGEGSEFRGLKEFGAGMDRRFVDWKRSARHGKLLAREFEVERNHQVIFAFDCGQLMAEPVEGLARLDWAVNSALRLAHVCLRAGDKVGLAAFDARNRSFLKANGGPGAFLRFAAATGDVASSPLETNFTLGLTALSGKLERRSLIILMSEMIDTTTAELMVENLGRLARRHLVLFVTFRDPVMAELAEAEPDGAMPLARAVVTETMMTERRVLFERLRRMGLLVLEAHPRHLTSRMIDQYLDIRARELI